ncbi:hypothetical protein BC831DRAFT_442533 [Entophlyctis helioformis]|nr:hypothetical protein BC831DRAFT_442533 [Entophlyctis helioformis]
MSAPSAAWSTGRCTYHPYESDGLRLGQAYDNSPGWCGYRYSALNIARITALHGITAAECGNCLQIQSSSGVGPLAHVLVVDQKGDPGLDVAKSSFAALFPGENPLDQQVCRWRVVGIEHCRGVCGGPECAVPGVRNLLPAYLMAPLDRAVEAASERVDVGRDDPSVGAPDGSLGAASASPASTSTASASPASATVVKTVVVTRYQQTHASETVAASAATPTLAETATETPQQQQQQQQQDHMEYDFRPAGIVSHGSHSSPSWMAIATSFAMTLAFIVL